MTEPSLRAWLAEGPFTLAMSSGFFGFFAHAGLLCALTEAGLEPAAVRGSSAGALVTALWAAGLAPDRIEAELLSLKRSDFWDPRPGLGLLRGRLFDQHLRSLLPTTEFGRCRVPVAISVYDVLGRRTEALTGGDLPSAIRASCAVPGFFHPVWIGGRPKLDGGLLDRPGLHGLAAGERVLHHHLVPTSPWRKLHKPSQRPPERENLRAVAIAGLPLVTPFTLAAGRTAYREARAEAKRLLGE